MSDFLYILLGKRSDSHDRIQKSVSEPFWIMRRDCKCIRFEDGTAGFVCTEMEGNSLNVSVTQDFTCAWSGSGSLEDLNKIDKLDMRQVTDEALLRIPSTRTFMYALGCSEKESAVFKWKLSQGNVKFIIGSLKLKSVSDCKDLCVTNRTTM
ncbi:unnamed protein product, partial [Darwinula stevensoni]